MKDSQCICSNCYCPIEDQPSDSPLCHCGWDKSNLMIRGNDYGNQNSESNNGRW